MQFAAHRLPNSVLLPNEPEFGQRVITGGCVDVSCGE